MADGGIVTIYKKAILDTLGIMAQGKSQSGSFRKLTGDMPGEQIVSDVLEFGALHFDNIVRKMDKDFRAIGSLLSVMELKSFVR